MTIRLLLLALTATLSCSGGPSPPPAAKQHGKATAPASASAAAPAPVDPTEPVLVPSPAVRPAPWREEAWERPVPSDPFDSRQVIAVGVRTALVRAGTSTFAVSVRGGVIGPLAPPDKTRWLGLGGVDDDAVFAATSAGACLARSSARPNAEVASSGVRSCRGPRSGMRAGRS